MVLVTMNKRSSSRKATAASTAMRGVTATLIFAAACLATATTAFTPVQSSFASSCRQGQQHPLSVFQAAIRTPTSATATKMIPSDDNDSETTPTPRRSSFLTSNRQRQLPKQVATLCLGLTLAAGSVLGLGLSPASAAAGVAGDMQKYDGFAEYAQENKMEKSDVACFAQQCGEQTKALFSNPRGIKGVSCLGRCKGEQSCATRCFAEFGSESLNNWLSCTIEENGCVKVPKNEAIDNSAENVGVAGTLQNFDPSTLLGTWYKTDGLNPNYDLFDCQSNTFSSGDDSAGAGSNKNKNKELDMGIFFRVRRPPESGGGYWNNDLTEHMVVDAVDKNIGDENPTGRTMHTAGKMVCTGGWCMEDIHYGMSR
jgi:hypothetical protein